MPPDDDLAKEALVKRGKTVHGDELCSQVKNEKDNDQSDMGLGDDVQMENGRKNEKQ